MSEVSDCVYLVNRFRECHLADADKKVQSWIYEGDDMAAGKMSYMGHYNILQELLKGTLVTGDAGLRLDISRIPP